MSWNPEKYNQFKSARFAPFYDLLVLLTVKPGLEVIDLGCGTGELTRKLADQLSGSKVSGIDSSAEMLKEAAAFSSQNLKFEQKTIQEQLSTGQQWDLIFSNAAIQWVENHPVLLPQLISTLKPGGQLAIQIPSQNENILNRLLLELAQEEPYQTILSGWSRISPVLETGSYAQIFFENGSKSMTIYEKIYPVIAASHHALFDWIAGTALIPYMEKLNGEVQDNFIKAFKNRIQQEFPKSPVLYPFKRIILEAKF